MLGTTLKLSLKPEGKKGVPNLPQPSPAPLSTLLLSTAVDKFICCLIHTTSYPRKSLWDLCLVYPLSAAESFQWWMAPPHIFCLSEAAAVGKRRSRKSSDIQEVTFLTSSDPYLCLGATVWKDSKLDTRQNYKVGKEWGKAITMAGCWASLWEQLEMQLHSTHQKVISHVQNEALDKRLLRLKIDLTLGFTPKCSEQMKSSYINSSALWLPVELHPAAALPKHPHKHFASLNLKTPIERHTESCLQQGLNDYFSYILARCPMLEERRAIFWFKTNKSI